MSIPNLIHKIKSKTGIDKMTLLYLFVIIGVGIGSFGLGKLSVGNLTEEQAGVVMADRDVKGSEITTNTDRELPVAGLDTKEKRYVASKNGKMYYSLGCSGSKRIKSENEVWFSTQSDAEKSGYTLSSTCK